MHQRTHFLFPQTHTHTNIHTCTPTYTYISTLVSTPTSPKHISRHTYPHHWRRTYKCTYIHTRNTYRWWRASQSRRKEEKKTVMGREDQAEYSNGVSGERWWAGRGWTPMKRKRRRAREEAGCATSRTSWCTTSLYIACFSSLFHAILSAIDSLLFTLLHSPHCFSSRSYYWHCIIIVLACLYYI